MHERFTLPDNDRVKPAVVRPYTRKERVNTSVDILKTPEERFLRLIRASLIDNVRYVEAIGSHPDMRQHFESMIDAREKSVAAWSDYYADHYAVDTDAVIRRVEVREVPYGGTETPTVIRELRSPNQNRTDLPA